MNRKQPRLQEIQSTYSQRLHKLIFHAEALSPFSRQGRLTSCALNVQDVYSTFSNASSWNANNGTGIVYVAENADTPVWEMSPSVVTGIVSTCVVLIFGSISVWRNRHSLYCRWNRRAQKNRPYARGIEMV